jgi:hypothetical protein
MRLLLINPCNPLVSTVKSRENRWNKYVVLKSQCLLVRTGLTSGDWEISLIDKNLPVPDYKKLLRPDLVGVTAFTLQAGLGISNCSRLPPSENTGGHGWHLRKHMDQ